MFKRRGKAPRWFIATKRDEMTRGVGKPWSTVCARIEKSIRRKSRNVTEHDFLRYLLYLEKCSMRDRENLNIDGYFVDAHGILRLSENNRISRKKAKSAKERLESRHSEMERIAGKGVTLFVLNEAWFEERREDLGAWDEREKYLGRPDIKVNFIKKKIYRVHRRQLSKAEIRRYGLRDKKAYRQEISDKYYQKSSKRD